MRLSELIHRFSCEPVAPLVDDLEIKGVRPLSMAQSGDLSFLSNPRYRAQTLTTQASAILVKEPIEGVTAIQLRCTDPYATLAHILAFLFPEPVPAPGIDPTAYVAPSAKVAATAYVGPHCVISDGALIGENVELVARVHVGRGVQIGDHTKLFPGVVLYDGVTLGNRVRVHANSVIGSDGFGYAQTASGHLKVPQIGSVVIGDGAEIGAGTCIDRGALDDTVIGAGAIIDNLVQIGHGSKIGKMSVIVSQTGLSGSVQLGNGVVLAGKVGVVGHVQIADRVVVMGDSIVTKDLDKPGQYAGNPAIPHMKYQKQQAHLRMLPELKKRISDLEKRVGKDP